MGKLDLEIVQVSKFSGVTQEELAELRANRRWLWIEGLLLCAIGLVAIGVAGFSTIFSVALLGGVLLVGGIVQIGHSLSHVKAHGFLGSMLLGVAYVVGGFLVVQSPGATAMTLTLLLAPLFIVSGLFKCFAAIITRYPQWGWSMLSGVTTFVLGLFLWNQWPSSGLWFIGTLVGMELFIAGIAILTFASALKNAERFIHRQDLAA